MFHEAWRCCMGMGIEGVSGHFIALARPGPARPVLARPRRCWFHTPCLPPPSMIKSRRRRLHLKRLSLECEDQSRRYRAANARQILRCWLRNSIKQAGTCCRMLGLQALCSCCVHVCAACRMLRRTLHYMSHTLVRSMHSMQNGTQIIRSANTNTTQSEYALLADRSPPINQLSVSASQLH